VARREDDLAVLDVADRLALHELLNLYGHLVDDRSWDALDQVFTGDAVYDARDFGMPVTRSLDELVAEWTSEEGMQRHPLAHHATNIVVSEDDDGTVRVRSKGIGVGGGGRVGSVTYHDVAVRTPAGWRLATRTVTLRRPEA
jgi:3-phenylpropionate/cinnamic acid dioxygenase small subunit